MTTATRKMARILNWNSALTGCWLLLVLAVGVNHLISTFPSPNDFWSDEKYAYLRAAERLLAQGPSFFLDDPYSYRTAPLGYLWPVLWQMDAQLTRLASSALYLLCIPMLWHIGMRLSGPVAAVTTTLLFVIHDGLASHMPRILTEPLYIFGLVLFLLSTVEMAFNQRWRALWIWLGATGLTITLLSRPALQLFVLAALVVCLVPAPLLPSSMQKLTTASHQFRSSFLKLLLLALTLPLLVAGKNAVFFDVWGISTGSGAGLYQGVHPTTRGIEPVYLGMEYDVNDVVTAVSPRVNYDPLLAESDKIERKVAAEFMRGMSLQDNVRLFSTKLYYWIFYHPIAKSNFRVQRFFELFLVSSFCVAAFTVRRRYRWQSTLGLMSDANTGDIRTARIRWAFFSVISLVLLGMLLQMTALLHNVRYNIGFLELFFILLAAMALSGLTRASVLSRSMPWMTSGMKALAAWVGIAILVAAAALQLAQNLEKFALDPRRLGPVAVVLDAADRGIVHAQDMSSLPGDRWRISGPKPVLAIPFSPPVDVGFARWHFINGVWLLRMAVSTMSSPQCTEASVSYTPHQAPQPQFGLSQIPPLIQIKSDAKIRDYAIYGNRELRPAGSGELQLAFHCPIGTEIEWVDAKLVRSTIIESAASFMHEGKPIDPYRVDGKR